jgi:hypothetical protein
VFSKGKPAIGLRDQAFLLEHPAAIGPLPYMKDLWFSFIVFKFIIEYSSLRDFRP